MRITNPNNVGAALEAHEVDRTISQTSVITALHIARLDAVQGFPLSIDEHP